MSDIPKIDDDLVKRLAALPEAIGELKKFVTQTDERFSRAVTEAEKKATDALATAQAAQLKADEVRSKIKDASFALPGSEELVKQGKLRFGHFVAAAAVRELQGEARARALFPLVFDVDAETRKRLTPAGEDRLRTQVTHDDALGGFVVPEELSTQFVSYPYANSCLSKLNIVKATPRGKPFIVPKLTGSGTVYMTSETPGNSSVAKTTIQFGRGKMTPKKCIAIGAVSKELDELSDPSVLSYLENDLVTKIGLKLEQQVVEGKGGEYEVRGLDKYTAALDGINVVDLTGTLSGALTAAANGRDLTDYIMRHIANVAEAAEALSMGGKMQYLMPTKLKQVLALQQIIQYSGQKPDAGSAPALGYGIVDDARLEAMYGPIAHSNQFSTSRTIGGSSDGGLVVGGEFRNSFLPMWGGVVVTKADQAVLSNSSGAVTLNAFLEEVFLLKVVTSFDFLAVRPSDFVLATGCRSVRTGL